MGTLMDLYVQRRATLALLVGQSSWQETPEQSALFLQLVELYSEALACPSLVGLRSIEQRTFLLRGMRPPE